MAKLTVKIGKEELMLIKNLNIQKFDEYIVGVDTFDMYGGSFKYAQMALLLGYQDKVLKDTMESIFGPKYEEPVQKHLEEIDVFLTQNLVNIEEIIHQFCTEGIREGTYECKDNEHLWSYKG